MDFSRAHRMCSFCGRHGTEDNELIGGLGAMVCVECVEDFHGMVHSPEATAAAHRQPWDRMSDAEMLDTLPQILRSADQVNDFAVEWVELIRSRKISWAEIGGVLGISRQAAWERFAHRGGAGRKRAGNGTDD